MIDTVLDYIETTSRVNLKQKITVKRTQTSKYLFYLLVRQYRIETRKKPHFIAYQKTEASAVKGLLEEISLFGNDEMFVLEGFPLAFIETLHLPPGVYVLAEVDDGELDTPAYSYRQRRGILKVLLTQLGLKVSLRDLLSLDWGSVRDYSEVEVILRKATAAGWGLEGIQKSLQEDSTGNILLMLKKGNLPELLRLKSKYSDNWFNRNASKIIPQLATYRALVTMGQSPTNIAETLGISTYKLRELEEASKAVTMNDLKVLGERVLALDRMSMKWPGPASDLLIMKSGISLKR